MTFSHSTLHALKLVTNKLIKIHRWWMIDHPSHLINRKALIRSINFYFYTFLTRYETRGEGTLVMVCLTEGTWVSQLNLSNRFCWSRNEEMLSFLECVRLCVNFYSTVFKFKQNLTNLLTLKKWMVILHQHRGRYVASSLVSELSLWTDLINMQIIILKTVQN